MGWGFTLKCTKCEYEMRAHLESGYALPKKTLETIHDMKAGKYGKAAQKFFQENSEGSVDCDRYLFRCKECGDIQVEMVLDLYKPKEHVSELSYPNIYPVVLPGYYDKAMELEHKCKKCGCKMELQNEDRFLEEISEGKITCPNCGGHLEADADSWFDWD